MQLAILPLQIANPTIFYSHLTACHGKFKKLNLKVETKMHAKMVPQRKITPSWTKFNKAQKIFKLILYSKFSRIACTKFITAYQAKVLEISDAGQKNDERQKRPKVPKRGRKRFPE
jgi:hypothetical protein